MRVCGSSWVALIGTKCSFSSSSSSSSHRSSLAPQSTSNERRGDDEDEDEDEDDEEEWSRARWHSPTLPLRRAASPLARDSTPPPPRGSSARCDAARPARPALSGPPA